MTKTGAEDLRKSERWGAGSVTDLVRWGQVADEGFEDHREGKKRCLRDSVE